MRRLLHFIFIVAALACFAASGYGLYWIWNFKKPAIDTATYAFGEANKYLGIANSAMTEVQANLEVSRTQFLLAASTPPKKQPDPAGGSFWDGFIARTLVRQVTPNVSNVQNTVQRVTEASVVANSILESLPDMQLGPNDMLNTQKVRGLQDQLREVTAASWELGGLLDNSNNSTDDPAAKAANIAATLGVIINTTAEFQKQVEALQARAKRVEGSTLYWMDRAPTIASWFLGWVMFSQILLIVYIVRDTRKLA